MIGTEDTRKDRVDKLGNTAPLEPRAHASALRLLEVPSLFISELQSSECGFHICEPTGFLGGRQSPNSLRKMEISPVATGKLTGAFAQSVFYRLLDRLVMCGLFALVHLTTAVVELTCQIIPESDKTTLGTDSTYVALVASERFLPSDNHPLTMPPKRLRSKKSTTSPNPQSSKHGGVNPL